MSYKNGVKVLSVIIATYNRSKVLKENLEKFKQQTDKDFEVIVAIDGSTDDTIQMLGNFESDFGIKWVNTEETNKYCLAKARNMGLVECSGEAVVILDDDSFPTPDFVMAHKKSVRQRVLTGGYRNSHDPDDPMQPWPHDRRPDEFNESDWVHCDVCIILLIQQDISQVDRRKNNRDKYPFWICSRSQCVEESKQ